LQRSDHHHQLGSYFRVGRGGKGEKDKEKRQKKKKELGWVLKKKKPTQRKTWKQTGEKNSRVGTGFAGGFFGGQIPVTKEAR